MNCMNCGAMVLDGATVCPVCRQPLGPTQGTSGWQPPPVKPPGAQWQQPFNQQHIGPPPLGGGNSGVNPLITIVVAVPLLLVAVGGIAGFIFYSQSRWTSNLNKNDNYNVARVDTPPAIYQPPPPTSGKTPPRSSGTTISGGVLNGKALELPKPPYPAIAKSARASGTVTVQVTVDESGKVTSARAISGHSLLQAAAVQAAYKARFSPTLLSGKPVKVTGILTYTFTPE